jgi:drug/metabolite transporter (DMT)-like permease
VTPARARERRLAYGAWAIVCVLWGTTYFGIRVSLETMPPGLMGGIRWTMAGAALAAWLKARGESLPPPSRWASIALLGFLMLFLGNGGVVVAELWVPSGLTAVLVATSPFWMAGVEACMPNGEKLRPGVVAGLAVGFSGIVVLVWPELTLASPGHRGFLLGVLAVQVAALGWALGSSYSKRHAGSESLLGTTAYQMLFGGLMLIAAGTMHGEWSRLYFTTRSAAALLYLVSFGAIGGFVAYSYALRHLPVSFVSLYAYINPIIAVTLGVLLLHEPFNTRMTLSAALVFGGVAIVRRVKAAPAAAVKTESAGAPRRRQIA